MKYRKRNIFVNGVIIGSAGIACYLFRKDIIPGQRPFHLDYAFDCLGFILAICGQNIRIMARGYKSYCLSNKSTLITTGPYSLVRNPMYLGSFLIGLGLAVTILGLPYVVCYIIGFLTWYAWQIHNEQIFLRQRFGEPYRDYCQKVPCFFPYPTDIKTLTFFQPESFTFNWILREWNTIAVWTLTLTISEERMDSFNYYPSNFLLEMGTYVAIALVFIMAMSAYGTSVIAKQEL
jgi:protein-S-isoprenylcysteine O-methyltransferase Ste14